jgi:hypothetical protein
LDSLLKSRGYSTRRFNTLDSAYYNTPTPLQLASYGAHFLNVMFRDEDKIALQAALECGLSPNACSEYGDSLAHKVCRLGNHELLQALLQAGCSLQCADDFGITPLHTACWRTLPSFVEIVMQHDIHMFYLKDKRGSLPLSYVRKESHKEYIRFLDSVKDVYWPTRNVAKDCEEQPPQLTLEKPNSRPIPDPANALSLVYAKMVATGHLTPDDAQLLEDADKEEPDESFSSSGDDDDDDGCDSSSSTFSGDDHGYDDDEEEEYDSSSSSSESEDMEFDWDENMVADIPLLTRSCNQNQLQLQQQPMVAYQLPGVSTRTGSPSSVPLEVLMPCSIAMTRSAHTKEMYFL